MAKAELLTRAEDSEKYLATWYGRQDLDIARYLLEQYVWKNSKNEKMTDVEHVTLNDPRTFADRIIFQLGTAERRFDILSEDDSKSSIAERFLDFIFRKADEALAAQGEWPLEDYDHWNSSLRGGIGRRALLKTNGSDWDIDIRSYDVRCVSWEPGLNGCELVNFWGTKTGAEIKRDYGIEQKGDANKFKDVWTPEENAVFIEGKMAPKYPIKHNLGLNPAHIVLCPTTPLIGERSDAVKIRGESIYAPVRDMYDLLNKAGSSWFTNNMLSILPALQFISKDGRKSKTPPFGIKTVANIRAGEKYELIGLKDVSTSHQAWFGQVMARIQRATYSNFDYGDLSFQLSALAMKRLEAAKDQLYIPRIKAEKMMTIWTARTLITQFINGGYKTENLSDRAFKMDFKRSDFVKPFQIQVDYFSESPETNLAAAQEMQVYESLGFPKEYTWKVIGKVKDYAGIKEMSERERLELESEAVRKYKMAMALLKTGDPDDTIQAQLALKEIGLTLQMQRPAQGQQVKGKGGSPANIIPGMMNNPVPGATTSPEAQTANMEQARLRGSQMEQGGQAQQV